MKVHFPSLPREPNLHKAELAELLRRMQALDFGPERTLNERTLEESLRVLIMYARAEAEERNRIEEEAGYA